MLYGNNRPMRDNFLPFCKPAISSEEKDRVLQVLDSGWLSTGPMVKEFEEEMCKYLGSTNAIAVNSCTAGLHLSLVALGIGPGDEVITSPFTFVSTANVIEQCGAKPVLADIDVHDCNISPEKVRELVSDKTKAIIPVHYGGDPYNINAIDEIANEHNLRIIQDAATAIGASYQGSKIGSSKKDVTVFSFYATKTMTTGEGGLICLDDDNISNIIRALSLHGLSRDAWKRYSSKGSWFFEVSQPGFKYNMSDFQAALGISQLIKLDSMISKRKKISKIYDSLLESIPEIITFKKSKDIISSRYIYTILLDIDSINITRDEFIEKLKSENIGSSVHYIPVYLHPYYRDKYSLSNSHFPNTDYIYNRIISLPLFPDMEVQDVSDVVSSIKKIINSS